VQISWDKAAAALREKSTSTGHNTGNAVAEVQRLLSSRPALPPGYYGGFSFGILVLSTGQHQD
jgi:hypothetical protein